MKGLLIEKDDVISITVFVGLDKNDELYTDEDKAKLKEFNVIDSSIEELEFSFRKPTYKDEVELVSGSVEVTDRVGIKIDPAFIRYQRMINLIKDWSLKDDQGNKIPLNQENVDKLNPKVAMAVLNALDDVLND